MHLTHQSEDVPDEDEDESSSSWTSGKNSGGSPPPPSTTSPQPPTTSTTSPQPPPTSSDQSPATSEQSGGQDDELSPLEALKQRRSLSRITAEFQRRVSKEHIHYEDDLESEEITDKVTEMDPPSRKNSIKSICRSERSPSFERIRHESECSSTFSEDLEIYPIGLDDISFAPKSGYISSSEDDFHYSPTERGRFFTKTTRNKKKVESRGKRNWRRAIRLVKDRGDAWQKFKLDQLQTERGIRHRYNPLTMEWLQDECILKMDIKPFANGAMRQCFRMKKLSNFSNSNDWLRDSNNYVAKSYIDNDVDRNMYFQDVKLQMDAKLWGEEFNRHNPPKKVDIFMMSVLELPDRQGKPLYHVEHYIDGDYIKYNSNSGFVDIGGGCRQTPQAFSHFTFERSGHELMVVDIQGVGDLYTDPQIHTAQGDEYGDGNLGSKGMALFFHSHKCNSICESLGLAQFDLSAGEIKSISAGNKTDSLTSETRVRLDQIVLCESPSLHEKTDFRSFFRQRSGSHGFVDFSRTNSLFSERSRNSSRYNSECEGSSAMFNLETDEDQEDDEDGHHASVGFVDCPQVVDMMDRPRVTKSEERHISPKEANLNLMMQRKVARNPTDTETSADSGIMIPRRRQRCTTESFEDWNNDSEAVQRKNSRMPRKSRPSCISAEVLQISTQDSESILGQIHLDLAKYHETCRFDEDVLDTESALFHLKAAADCGNLCACIALSQLLTGLLNDILPALTPHDVVGFINGQVEDIGLDYMTRAAYAGDSNSALYLAKAFDTGLNLGTDRKANAEDAVRWYEKALELEPEQPYLIAARIAEIYLSAPEGIIKNATRAAELYTEAAESAMEDMKGKLANKYYMMAEEAWAQCQD